MIDIGENSWNIGEISTEGQSTMTQTRDKMITSDLLARATGLAQTSQNAICTYAQDRNKSAAEDFYGIMNQTTGQYSDSSFPADISSVYFANGDSNETGSRPYTYRNNISWTRASDMQDKTLFGS